MSDIGTTIWNPICQSFCEDAHNSPAELSLENSQYLIRRTLQWGLSYGLDQADFYMPLLEVLRFDSLSNIPSRVTMKAALYPCAGPSSRDALPSYVCVS